MSIFFYNQPFETSYYRDPFDFDSLLTRRIGEALNTLDAHQTNQQTAAKDKQSAESKDVAKQRTPRVPTIRAPRLDIAEDKDTYIIRADVPGLQKEEISINVQDDILTIEGTRKNHHEEKNEKYHVVERSFGKFTRSVRLPSDVDLENTSAAIEHGVLELKIKKKEQAEQVKKITIN
ncbi:hypothetical protein HK098_002868 [Nowakowskiella sp. JEL0407]|nr:hypothetical protein HK098_002868 [Nowakowskiella sp. JEL0407]